MALAEQLTEHAVRELFARHGVPVQNVWVARGRTGVSVSLSCGTGHLRMFGAPPGGELCLLERLAQYVQEKAKEKNDPNV